MHFKVFVVIFVFNIAALTAQHVKCYKCVVTVNTPDYVECKTLSNVKQTACPNGSTGCAVVRDHPKGKYAEFRRECIGKTSNYCETKKKNDTDPKYFSCSTCHGDGCNKILLK
ncbi:uncharacterized protein LOC123681840 [Harmonia axyridis]|uniref:uncharacterized protein LOC123681840 n=1 Tax=Harmonia axyridis TaxID=115357 RepID=UPI001E27815C|nr:uncharacterized protein LOC123681840 [Harmonia axyridis]